MTDLELMEVKSGYGHNQQIVIGLLSQDTEEDWG